MSNTPRRLAEAARLGFRTAIVPSSATIEGPGIDVQQAGTVDEAIALAGLRSRPGVQAAGDHGPRDDARTGGRGREGLDG